jgi:hypothetical protein
MPNAISTTIHVYRFHVGNPDEARAYDALCEKLSASHPRVMRAWGMENVHDITNPALDGRAIELDVAHLFDNQWNTAPGSLGEGSVRVFDWYDAVFPNPNLKAGHYLDQTPEMVEIRRRVAKCGYCGAYYPGPLGVVFCERCRDNEYLTEEDLHLTRIVPVADTWAPGARPPLTEAERAGLLPLYRDAQLHGSSERGRARVAKRRADVETTYRKAVANAEAERLGMTWLLDRLPQLTDNVIYYSHTGRFGFGWRKPLEPTVLSTLLDVISEFPVAYDITCADGRKLNGER